MYFFNFFFRPAGRDTFSCLPKRSCTFLCVAKEKYQKKSEPGGWPAARVPCASREARRLRNSRSRYARFAQTGRKLPPGFTAMLGCARRDQSQNNKTKPRIYHPRPVCAHRVPQTIRDQGRSCLSAASSAHPLIVEERRASASADECSGCPSLWVLSLGQARESISPRRAKPAVKKCEQIKRLPPTAANPNTPSNTYPPPGHIAAPHESPKQPATVRGACRPR